MTEHDHTHVRGGLYTAGEPARSTAINTAQSQPTLRHKLSLHTGPHQILVKEKVGCMKLAASLADSVHASPERPIPRQLQQQCQGRAHPRQLLLMEGCLPCAMTCGTE